MANGFTEVNSVISEYPSPLNYQLALASTQFGVGDALISVKGRMNQVSSQTSKVDGIFNSMTVPASVIYPGTKNLSTTADEQIAFIRARGTQRVFRTDLVNITADSQDAPPFSQVAFDGTSTATSVVFTGSGSTNDLVGGTLYALGVHRNIITDTVAAGKHTLTIDSALPRTPTTADVLSAVAFGAISSRGVKLASTNPHRGISTAVGDTSGGSADIVRVSLSSISAGSYPVGNQAGNRANPYVDVQFQA
jgi:hypothetical protein